MKKNSYQKQKDKIKELEKTIDVLINGTFDEKLIISKQYKILSSIEDMMWKSNPILDKVFVQPLSAAELDLLSDSVFYSYNYKNK